MLKKILVSCIILVVSILVLHRTVILYKAAQSKTIYNNIFIHNIPVGGLTTDEAKIKLWLQKI